MKLSEVYKIADEIAPKRLSDEYCRNVNGYDNSGLLIEACDEVKGILFSLDLTNAAIDEAIANGVNLIITHHPVIYGKIDHICLVVNLCKAFVSKNINLAIQYIDKLKRFRT